MRSRVTSSSRFYQPAVNNHFIRRRNPVKSQPDINLLSARFPEQVRKPKTKPTPVEPPPVQAQPVEFPLKGEYRLVDLLEKFNLDLENTRLPETNRTLHELLDRAGVGNLNTIVLTIDPEESVNDRLKRWGFDPENPISIRGREPFKKVILGTLENYFRLHPDGPPGPNHNPQSKSNQFANALYRTIFGHDLYTPTLTTGESKAVPDGSVLFETAFAAKETGNDDLLRHQDVLLSQLDMIQFDALDGVLNGKELKHKAAYLFDQAAGTHYLDAVTRFSPNRQAVIDPQVLQGPFGFPLTEERQRELAALSGTSLETFTRGNVVFHALTIGSQSMAAENAPANLTEFNRQEAEGALAGPFPGSGRFGFISWLFPAVSKEIMQADLNTLNTTGHDTFLFGDDTHGGAAGKGSFLDSILFDQYGVSSLQLRERGRLY